MRQRPLKAPIAELQVALDDIREDEELSAYRIIAEIPRADHQAQIRAAIALLRAAAKVDRKCVDQFLFVNWGTAVDQLKALIAALAEFEKKEGA